MSQTSLCVVLLFIAVVALKVNCQEKSRSGDSVATYDVGCYTNRAQSAGKNLFSSLFRSFALPTCEEGGVYKVVQCTTDRCSCAYVDTGTKFGNGTHGTEREEEMSRECPIRTEKYATSCERPPINYPCDLSKQKYSYNAEKRRCEVAAFGCFGYKTKEECRRTCETSRKPVTRSASHFSKCSLPLNVGRRCSQERERRYRHNSATGRCEDFIYEGCFGNANNYKTKWECQRDCVPQGNITIKIQVDFEQQYFVVLSDWLMTRFRLSHERMNDVSREIFGDIRKHASSMDFIQKPSRSTTGPKPNSRSDSNSLDEEVERHRSPPEETCLLASDTGTCRGFFARWYYSHEESKCKRFTYGGCQANDNNFLTLRECVHYCKPVKKAATGENVYVP